MAYERQCSMCSCAIVARREGINSAAGTPDTSGQPSTHAFEADPRNADTLIGLRDGVTERFAFQWRPAAKVSVHDAGFLLGDGVWEGLRVHKGCILFVWVCLLPAPCAWHRLFCRAEKTNIGKVVFCLGRVHLSQCTNYIIRLLGLPLQGRCFRQLVCL